MKIVALILSVHIFALSMFPCTDVGVCGAADGDKVEHSDDHDHSGEHEDTCPPFCVCSCCGIVFTFLELNDLPIQIYTPNYSYSHHYQFDYAYLHHNSLWRPPALS